MVEELRKKQELEDKLSKLRRQQEELERERREVQDLLRGFAQGAGHHPRRARGARRVSQPRQASRPSSALDLRIDKDKKERLEYELEKLQQKVAEMEASEWARDLEFQARPPSVEEGKVKFGMLITPNKELQGEDQASRPSSALDLRIADKDKKERLEYELEKLQQKVAEMEASEWARDLEFQARPPSVEEGKVKFGMLITPNKELQGEDQDGKSLSSATQSQRSGASTRYPDSNYESSHEERCLRFDMAAAARAAANAAQDAAKLAKAAAKVLAAKTKASAKAKARAAERAKERAEAAAVAAAAKAERRQRRKQKKAREEARKLKEKERRKRANTARKNKQQALREDPNRAWEQLAERAHEAERKAEARFVKSGYGLRRAGGRKRAADDPYERVEDSESSSSPDDLEVALALAVLEAIHDHGTGSRTDEYEKARAEIARRKQMLGMVDSAAGGLAERCRDIDPLLGRCREELYACVHVDINNRDGYPDSNYESSHEERCLRFDMAAAARAAANAAQDAAKLAKAAAKVLAAKTKASAKAKARAAERAKERAEAAAVAAAAKAERRQRRKQKKAREEARKLKEKERRKRANTARKNKQQALREDPNRAWEQLAERAHEAERKAEARFVKSGYGLRRAGGRKRAADDPYERVEDSESSSSPDDLEVALALAVLEAIHDHATGSRTDEYEKARAEIARPARKSSNSQPGENTDEDCNMVDSAAGGLAERCRDIDPLLLGRCRERSASCSSSHFREAERGMEKKSTKHTSLRDLHYERMRQQAEERLAILRQREVQREPWTAPDAGRHLPRRPWSAIPGYTGFRRRRVSEAVRRGLVKAHCKLGHPSVADLQRLLKLGGAKQEVIEAAGWMKCMTCAHGRQWVATCPELVWKLGGCSPPRGERDSNTAPDTKVGLSPRCLASLLGS
ncbi:hypothetical protein AK812_SmicGene39865 [Symbiodinium microadriaticum]|uniref:Uncharacterized protein n=1 Tax=Symbiodinium microadriaticum TaxID=2951 RepID=A0A1Q9CA53_SYMMI|nr:hypothetical protein AK812_SmicGene39865 [Symbiodinium microadriaticum]